MEKVIDKYGGDARSVKDLLRASLVVDSANNIAKVLAEVDKVFPDQIKRDDKFKNPLPSGYRDINIVADLGNGLRGEIQIHLNSMIEAKKAVHKLYAEWRTVKNTNQERAGFLNQLMSDVYRAAFNNQAFTESDALTMLENSSYEAGSTMSYVTKSSGSDGMDSLYGEGNPPNQLDSLPLESTDKGTPSRNRAANDVPSGKNERGGTPGEDLVNSEAETLIQSETTKNAGKDNQNRVKNNRKNDAQPTDSDSGNPDTHEPVHGLVRDDTPRQGELVYDEGVSGSNSEGTAESAPGQPGGSGSSDLRRGNAGKGDGNTPQPRSASRGEPASPGEGAGQRPGGRAGGNQPDVRKRDRPVNEADRNAVIDPSDTPSPKGLKAKADANLAAMRLLSDLEEQGRNPSPEEQPPYHPMNELFTRPPKKQIPSSQPPYHPMASPPNTLLKKQIPSSSSSLTTS